MGRTTFSGPVTGSYSVITITGDDIGINEDTIYRFVAPAAMRVMEVCASANAFTAGVNYALLNQTQGLAAIVAARTFPAANATEVLTPTSSPALANRNIANGDIIRMDIDADGTGDLGGWVVMITVQFTGHVVTAALND